MLSTYDPSKIVCNFAGHNIEGYANGTFLTVSRKNDSFVTETGADHRSIRTKQNDESGLVVVTLMQSSLSNDILSSFALVDELTGNGAGPLTIKDLRGTSLYTCPFAWVIKPADGGFSKANTNREWRFDCVRLKMLTGGIPFNI